VVEETTKRNALVMESGYTEIGGDDKTKCPGDGEWLLLERVWG